MRVGAKICGLSTSGTIDAAIAGGASHVGFNLYAPSPRYVAPATLEALAVRLPTRVGAVAVLVDPDDALLAAVAPHVSAFQLHNTRPERVAAIRALFAREAWAVIAVRTRADIALARQFVGAADRLVYDAKTPAGAPLPGGMGVRFDWSLLDGFVHPLPWVLSGGLDPSNVVEAARRTGAPMVDVASGVESAPGVKDAAKISAFLAAVATL